MLTRVQKWGNSRGLRISKNLLEDAHIRVGDEVELRVQNGLIVVAPAKRIRGRHSLRKLVARIPKNYRPAETAWGKPCGREAW